MFSIVGYSLDKDIAKGKFLESNIFDVGGHDWSIQYYPNGCPAAEGDHISIFLCLKSKSEGVKAQVSFTILDQSGCALPLSKKTNINNFTTTNSDWGYCSFDKRVVLESNIKDDCFIIKTVVSVYKVFPVEPTAQFAVPPGNILQQLGQLLDNGNGADVTFEVDGQILSAHKCILAARSPVFSAQFFGPMKEKSDTTIKIEDMKAPVFKALLHFIYNDSFPEFEETKGSDEKQETKLMAQQLLVAADRYNLGRLKVICEKMLCGSIDTSNVVTLLSLAERHSCNHLKATCLKLLASPGILEEVAATEPFQFLIGSRPLILRKPSVKQHGFLLPITVVLFLFFFAKR